MRNATPLLGGAEVQSLIAGAWHTIIGSGATDRFQDILGADVRYNAGGGYRRPGEFARLERERLERERFGGYRHHHHRRHHHPHAWIQGEGGGSDSAALQGGGQSTQGGGGMASWPYAIAPRNELIDRPGPTRADRVVLPMSSGVEILPNTSAQITSRPQDVAFRPERIVIGQAGTDKGAADWIVNDVKVGNKSQFSQSGDVPGDLFAATTIDSYVSFATVQTAMDFVMLVTYTGTNEAGAKFYCAVLGTAAV